MHTYITLPTLKYFEVKYNKQIHTDLTFNTIFNIQYSILRISSRKIKLYIDLN